MSSLNTVVSVKPDGLSHVIVGFPFSSVPVATSTSGWVLFLLFSSVSPFRPLK